MKITYFVHSITEDNEKSLATGWMQGKLSEEGVKRALALRPDLTSRDFDAVFCSDLERALQSTELFFDKKFPLFIDWRITAIDYDKYAKKYSEEKTELERKLVEYTNNDKSFIVTSSYLLQLASRAKEVFESSQPDKKNKILRMLLANCQINEKRLQLNLLKPFSVLSRTLETQNWLEVVDALRNPRLSSKYQSIM